MNRHRFITNCAGGAVGGALIFNLKPIVPKFNHSPSLLKFNNNEDTDVTLKKYNIAVSYSTVIQRIKSNEIATFTYIKVKKLFIKHINVTYTITCFYVKSKIF